FPDLSGVRELSWRHSGRCVPDRSGRKLRGSVLVCGGLCPSSDPPARPLGSETRRGYGRRGRGRPTPGRGKECSIRLQPSGSAGVKSELWLWLSMAFPVPSIFESVTVTLERPFETDPRQLSSRVSETDSE